MFDIFLSSIYHYQEHASFTYSNSSCYQYFSLLILAKVCLFNFRYLSFFLAKSYYSVAAILNVPEISQNKRFLAKTNVDKIFDKILDTKLIYNKIADPHPQKLLKSLNH